MRFDQLLSNSLVRYNKYKEEPKSLLMDTEGAPAIPMVRDSGGFIVDTNKYRDAVNKIINKRKENAK